MFDYLEKRATEVGFLPEGREQFDEFKRTSYENSLRIRRRGIPKQGLVNNLEDLGFRVEDHRSSYGRYVAFLRCMKV
ncbi:MAG: hypothetical protein ABIH37_02350 [archaeon]